MKCHCFHCCSECNSGFVVASLRIRLNGLLGMFKVDFEDQVGRKVKVFGVFPVGLEDDRQNVVSLSITAPSHLFANLRKEEVESSLLGFREVDS